MVMMVVIVASSVVAAPAGTRDVTMMTRKKMEAAVAPVLGTQRGLVTSRALITPERRLSCGPLLLTGPHQSLVADRGLTWSPGTLGVDTLRPPHSYWRVFEQKPQTRRCAA